MGGRFGLFADLDRLAGQFGFDPLTARDLFDPSYSVVPRGRVLAPTAAGTAREPQLTCWEFLPPWQRRGDPPGRPVFNARSETVAQKTDVPTGV